MRTCQYNNSNKHWSLSEYNNNNAWYYNGNNGRFNNNNKYNSNECRPVLELYYDDSHLEDYPIPYSDFLGSTRYAVDISVTSLVSYYLKLI